jgi:hypothetical protein
MLAETPMNDVVNFRPKEQDTQVMKLIEGHHPLMATDRAAIIRLALEFYWRQHNDPDSEYNRARGVDARRY